MESEMRKATAIYNAPEDDSKVVEMGGVTFYHGKEVELNSDDHGDMIEKLKDNPHFDLELGEEVPDDKPKRGRKTRDLKAGIDEARDHDFEADRRAQTEPKGQGDENPVGFTGTSPKPESKPAEETRSQRGG